MLDTELANSILQLTEPFEAVDDGTYGDRCGLIATWAFRWLNKLVLQRLLVRSWCFEVVVPKEGGRRSA